MAFCPTLQCACSLNQPTPTNCFSDTLFVFLSKLRSSQQLSCWMIPTDAYRCLWYPGALAGKSWYLCKSVSLSKRSPKNFNFSLFVFQCVKTDYFPQQMCGNKKKLLQFASFFSQNSSYLSCRFSSCRSSSPLQRVTESACRSLQAHRKPPLGCCRCPELGCWRTCWAARGGPGPAAWARSHGTTGNAGGKGRGVSRRQVTASVGCARIHGAEAGGDAAGRAGGSGGGGAGRETGRHRPGSWRWRMGTARMWKRRTRKRPGRGKRCDPSVRGESGGTGWRRDAGPAPERGGCAGSRTACDPWSPNTHTHGPPVRLGWVKSRKPTKKKKEQSQAHIQVISPKLFLLAETKREKKWEMK